MVTEHTMEFSDESKLNIYNIPTRIRSNYYGFDTLMSFFDTIIQNGISKHYTLEFCANAWFDANLFPVLYAYLAYCKFSFDCSFSYKYNRHSSSRKIHDLMIRNGFAEECFHIKTKPRESETVVPFKIFDSTDTYSFGKYIDSEIVLYLPAMDPADRRGISAYIQELFGNAQIHGECRKVFTCGQYYRTKGKMDFTIVNLGKTFGDNVIGFFNNIGDTAPDHSIAWAVEPEHSTKLTSSGGWGLSLMREFIHYNNGRFQIVSGDEYWELNKQKEVCKRFNYSFPGTIVNIEIDQRDKNYYSYSAKEISEELF